MSYPQKSSTGEYSKLPDDVQKPNHFLELFVPGIIGGIIGAVGMYFLHGILQPTSEQSSTAASGATNSGAASISAAEMPADFFLYFVIAGVAIGFIAGFIYALRKASRSIELVEKKAGKSLEESTQS